MPKHYYVFHSWYFFDLRATSTDRQQPFLSHPPSSSSSSSSSWGQSAPIQAAAFCYYTLFLSTFNLRQSTNYASPDPLPHNQLCRRHRKPTHPAPLWPASPRCALSPPARNRRHAAPQRPPPPSPAARSLAARRSPSPGDDLRSHPLPRRCAAPRAATEREDGSARRRRACCPRPSWPTWRTARRRRHFSAYL